MDQAADLRARAGARDATATRSIDPGVPARDIPVIVVGSGKGGVGKSVLAAALAHAVARRGRRVMLVDGAQNQGNQHILLGVRPAAKLSGLLAGEATAAELLTPVTDGMWLLPADSGEERVYALTSVDRARLHQRLIGLYDDFDAIVVDAGPGLESAVRVAAMRGTRVVVVAVPEPASLSDAYALIKMLTLQVPTLPIGVLVNRTLHPDEALAAFARLELAAHRFLNRPLELLGNVPEHDALRLAARRPGSVLEKTVGEIDDVAGRLLAGTRAPEATGLGRCA